MDISLGFRLEHRDKKSRARAGKLLTSRGVIKTPIFMPVGTSGAIKAMDMSQLYNPIQAQIILANTYHLYLRPGMDIIKGAGGIHGFNNWTKPVLTDSGGYQVYSLSDNCKIREEGVDFQSHIDGSRHLFSPERVIEIQRMIGADVMMAFDECTPYPCDYHYAKKSMNLTHRWLDRCFTSFHSTSALYGHEQMLAPIVQGSVYEDLRKSSAEYISAKNAEINAIGGLSVGEPAQELYKHTGLVCEILPNSKARYLMGVGTPENLLECIDRGVDMFDCVLPTRNARHGLIYTWNGRINIKNKKWEQNFEPIDDSSKSEMSRNYSKAYLRHLIHSKEYFGLMIASVHNLCFYLELVEQARKKILEDQFASWKTEVLSKIQRRL
jgi:queuine tRNA-ribosyltransferase